MEILRSPVVSQIRIQTSNSLQMSVLLDITQDIRDGGVTNSLNPGFAEVMPSGEQNNLSVESNREECI